MNAVYQQCLLKCRHLASAEGLQASMHCNKVMPAVSQSVADQLLYMSAIEMVSSIVPSSNLIRLVSVVVAFVKKVMFSHGFSSVKWPVSSLSMHTINHMQTHTHTHIRFTALWTLSRITTQFFTGRMPFLLPTQTASKP